METFTDIRKVLEALNVQRYGAKTPTQQLQTMRTCSTVNTAITKRATSIRSARIEVNGKDGAQEMVNSKQTIADLMVAIEMSLCIFGRAYIRKVEVVGMDFNSIELLSNARVTEYRTNNTLQYYTYSDGVSTYRLTPDDIMVLDDIDGLANLGDGFPVSRMLAIEGNIKTTGLISEVCVDLISNRGALGVISVASDADPLGDLPSTKSEKQSIYARFSSAFGVLTGKMKYWITHLKTEFIKISADITDMGLDGISARDIEKITEIYEVPRIMLGMADSTFSNLADAKKFFLEEVVSNRGRQIARFISEVIGKEVLVYFDHLESFQASREQKATANLAYVEYLNSAVESGFMTPQVAQEQFNELTIWQ